MPDPDDLTLVEPRLDQQDAYVDMAREFTREGAQHGRWAVDEASFEGFVLELRRQARADDLLSIRVPQTTYWLVRSDGVIVGTSRLRHRLTPELEIFGGHIGYDVRPSERRKGYGTRLLALTLDKARALGLTYDMLTCDDDNVASYRVMERNGGRLPDRVSQPDTGRLARRYWFALDAGAAC